MVNSPGYKNIFLGIMSIYSVWICLIKSIMYLKDFWTALLGEVAQRDTSERLPEQQLALVMQNWKSPQESSVPQTERKGEFSSQTPKGKIAPQPDSLHYHAKSVEGHPSGH